MNFLKTTFELLRETAVSFGKNNGTMLAASLAYYTIFAIAPLLVIAVAVAGFVFGDAAVQGDVFRTIEGTVGTEAGLLIEDLIASASQSNAGIFATVISIALLLVAASNLFGQLKNAINAVWDVAPTESGGIVTVVLQKAIAIGMVLLVGIVLIASISASALIATLGGFLAEQLPIVGPLLPYLEIIVSIVILILLFALILKILPDAKLAWRDLLVGGAVTALLFSIGKYLISFYLSFSGENPTYQAAGSVVILLLWIYYSAQIVLFGAQFTKVYADYAERKQRPFPQKPQSEQLIPTPRTANMPLEQTKLLAQTAVSHDETRTTIAALLLGTALGLLMAFVGRLFRE